MIRIVCDAGPIIHLAEADLLCLLRNCGSISAPTLVAEEARNVVAADPWPDWIAIRTLDRDAARAANRWVQFGDLHGGEAEAFALAAQTGADWLLTDDAGARLFAATMGMEMHGTLGVVLWNVAHGRLGQEAGLSALASLRQTSMWLSAHVQRDAEEAVMRICPGR
jgi:predicted nucleic acid-binding protein